MFSVLYNPIHQGSKTSSNGYVEYRIFVFFHLYFKLLASCNIRKDEKIKYKNYNLKENCNQNLTIKKRRYKKWFQVAKRV